MYNEIMMTQLTSNADKKPNTRNSFTRKGVISFSYRSVLVL
ncbi:MAG: hypothetical protein WDM71_02130 [Ferruginibacter sp.]